MTVIADLTTTMENNAARLAAISGLANDKLTYSVDGRSMGWTEYQAYLIKSIDDLNRQILALSGSFETRTQAYG